MKKKNFVAVSLISAAVLIGAVAYADPLGMIHALTVQHSISVDGEPIDSNDVMLSVDDRTYMQVRDICDLLGGEAKWNEETGSIEITTAAGEIENSEAVTSNELGISCETAVIIADDVFRQIMGNEFFEETTLFTSNDKGGYYSITRAKKFSVGGDHTLIIRKSDGKVMKMIIGE